MISLVVTTKNRSKEIQKLLASLCLQSETDFEVIIVDQNEDSATEEAVKAFDKKLRIQYQKTPLRGASRGKNLGIKHARGEWIGFPDDDCWYHIDVLKQIKESFLKSKADLISVPVVDPDLKNVPIMPFLKEPQQITISNVWHGGVVAGIFCTLKYAKEILYDEHLGVGSGTIYGSGEETDFLIRGVLQKYNLQFLPQILIYHPLKDTNIGKDILSRNYMYGAGLGRVLKKNKYPVHTVFKNFVRPLGGSIIYLLKGDVLKSKSYLASLSGRIKGYFF